MDNSRRILLLPGFSEDDLIFRHLQSFLLGHAVEIANYQPVLRRFNSDQITLDKFINSFIDHYQISNRDILIGHSLGGYFAHHIRQVTGCENCLISSFTDPKRIKLPVSYRKTIEWLTRKGIIGSGLYKKYVLLRFGNRESRKDLKHTFRVLEKLDREDVFKLVRILLPPKKGFFKWLKSGRNQLAPSLMIHSSADDFVRVPAEDHIKVPGGHFAVTSHPEVVGRQLENWLIRLRWAKATKSELGAESVGYELAHLWVA